MKAVVILHNELAISAAVPAVLVSTVAARHMVAAPLLWIGILGGEKHSTFRAPAPTLSDSSQLYALDSLVSLLQTPCCLARHAPVSRLVALDAKGKPALTPHKLLALGGHEAYTARG